MVGDCDRVGRDVRAVRLVRRGQLGQAEVEHLDGAIGRDRDVGRLEIAMDDALLVRRGEGLGNLPRQGHGLVQRQRPAGDAVGQRLALDEFEDQRMRLAAVLEAIDRADVRMVERGQHLRFAAEAGEPLGVERERRRRSPSARRRDSAWCRARDRPRPCRRRPAIQRSRMGRCGCRG